MRRSPLLVGFTPGAARQIEEATRWSRLNRLEAPDAIAEELDRVTQLLALQPATGAPARASRLRGARRVLLDRIDHHVYYRVRSRLRQVEIFAFWHTRRGSEPQR